MNGNHSPRETLNLNGAWSIVFDPDNAGEAQSWQQEGIFLSQAVRPIAVPSCWEEIENLVRYATHLSGSVMPANKELEESLAHYRMAFEQWRTKLDQRP